LPARSTFATVNYKIIEKVPAKEVVHVVVKAHYPELANKMDPIPFGDLMKLFHHCPHLSHLTAHVTEDSTPWDSLPAITLPHLQSLTLHGTTLDFLTLPHLTRLETDLSNAALFSFLERTASGLKHLAIEFE
jgi:hypothetical protein